MDDPLLKLPNCVIAPHIASATVQHPQRAWPRSAADNLIAGVNDEPLRCWVNPEVECKRRK